MNTTSLEPNRTIRTLDLIVSPSLGAVPVPAPAQRRRRLIWLSLVTFVSIVVLLNWMLAIALDYGPAELRDPEYGYRLKMLRQQVRQHPQRPLVVILGSSRTAQGIRPDVYEQTAIAGSPLLFNLSQSGGGPLLQLLTYRRLIADGMIPSSIIVEFWPPFLRGDGPFREQNRIRPERLRTDDEPTVQEFFDNADEVWTRRNGDSFVPLLAHRRNLLTRLCPDLLPQTERTDEVWNHLDNWGWWPGRISATSEQIVAGWPTVEAFYQQLFYTYHIDATHDRAYRTLLNECLAREIPTLLLRMPESKRFQSLQTAESTEMADHYRKQLLVDFPVPFIDGRTWANEEHLPDGFHLTQDGATKFTQQLFAIIHKTTHPNRNASSTVSRP
jgi:hypothetical protein